MAVADSFSVRHRDIDVVTDFMITIDLIVTQALYFKVRGLEIGVGYYQNAGLADLLNFGQRSALFVEQVSGHIYRHDSPGFHTAILDGFFFQQAQNG